MNCVVCNKSSLDLIGVVYNYYLRVDTICMKCFLWMDEIFTRAGCRSETPYRKNNPRIIYYSTTHPSNIY